MKFNELDEDGLLIRRKRVDENGEWEYECRYCDKWLPKVKFRGCSEYIDAYGNCLMCSSCRSKKSKDTMNFNIRLSINEVLNRLGYDTSGEIPVWKQFYKRHNLEE